MQLVNNGTWLRVWLNNVLLKKFPQIHHVEPTSQLQAQQGGSNSLLEL